MPTFSVSSKEFARALAQVTAVVSANPIVPILDSVWLAVTGSVVGEAATLRLKCSNLETDLIAALPVTATENFQAAVPAKKLLALLRGLPEAPVACAWNPADFAFTVAVGKSKYKIVGENPADFPRPRKADTPAFCITLPVVALRAALTATLSLCSVDASRPAMTAVLVEATPLTLRFVGCDGHRIGYWESNDNTADGAQWSGTGSFLVPKSAAVLLLAQLDPKSTDNVTLSADATSVRTDGGRWTARLVDERYPEYRNVIPGCQDTPNVAVVDRDELLATARRLEQLANEKTKQVRLVFSANELTAAVEDLDFNSEGSEVLGCDYTGAELEIGFSAAYLAQTLALLPAGPVRVAMSTPDRAALLSAESDRPAAPALLYLVMPLTLHQYV